MDDISACWVDTVSGALVGPGDQHLDTGQGVTRTTAGGTPAVDAVVLSWHDRPKGLNSLFSSFS
jgi:hypothetical protein